MREFGRVAVENLRAFKFVLATCLALAFLTSPAATAEGWRVISGDGKTITSDCIGKPVTPTCIVDTMVACEVLSAEFPVPEKPEITHPACYSLGWISNPYPFPDFNIRVNRPRHLVVYYYRLKEWTFTKKDLPHFARFEDWRVGDLAVDVWFRNCRPHQSCLERTQRDPEHAVGEGCPRTDCYESEYPRTLILRREREHWRIVAVYNPYTWGGAAQRGLWKRK